MAKKNNSVKKSIEDNKRITNKGIYILITCVLLIAIVVVIVLLINKKDTKELKKDVVAPIVNEEKGVIQDQEYDGLTFTSASLVYENGISTLVTTVSNPTDSDYYLDEFHIFVKDKNGNDVINYYDEDGNLINYLVGYVGEKIPAGGSTDITTSIDFDISSFANNISYEVVK